MGTAGARDAHCSERAQRRNVGALTENSFRHVFDAHYAYVCRALVRLGVDLRDADDVAQELFVLVARDLPASDQTKALRPWLYAFVVRFASNYRRLRRHSVDLRGAPHDAEVSAHRASQAEATAEVVARDLVLRALSGLDDEKRTALVLHDFEGLAAPEIAEVLQIPLNTVYSRIRLAREAFRERCMELQQKGESLG